MSRSSDLDFTEFVTVASARLFRTAYAVSGDRQLAEDALQAGLVSAYASWSRVARSDNPEAYVRRIVMNQLLRLAPSGPEPARGDPRGSPGGAGCRVAGGPTR